MKCSRCGGKIPTSGSICPACGAPAAAKPPKRLVEGKQVGETICLCQDGKYRWVYEVPMLRNPTILLTVWKVLGIAFGAVFLLFQLISLLEGSMSWESLLGSVRVFGLLALVFLGISTLAYLIVAAVYGWKYVVLFEMDERQVHHIQVYRQHKKAEILGLVTALAGQAGGRPGTAGIGLQAAARSTTTTEFACVRSIRPCRSRHVIRLSQGLAHNQIYAGGADFDFVLDYITARCPQARGAA